MYQPWKAQLDILQEGPAPLKWCSICVMHMHVENMIQHQRTESYNRETEMQLRRSDVEIYQRLVEMNFSLYNREDDPFTEGVMQFRYLGRKLE